MKRTLLVFFAAFAVLSTGAARAKVVSNYGVAIQSCVVNQSGGLSNGINVVYYNTHPSPAVEVDFLVGYHGHRAVFADRGTFSQNAAINHNMNAHLVGLAWNGPSPGICEVRRVVLANGRVFGP